MSEPTGIPSDNAEDLMATASEVAEESPTASGYVEIVRNVVSLVSTTGVTSVLGAVYWAIAARNFAPAAVGVAAAAISAMTLLSTISVLGFGSSLTTEFPRHPGREATLIGTAVAASGVFGIILGMSFALLTPWLFTNLRPLVDSPIGAPLFAIGVALTAVAFVVDQALIGLLRTNIQFLRNLLFGVLKLALLYVCGVWLIGVTGITIYATWAVGVAVSLVALMFLALFTRRRLRKFLPDLRLLHGIGRNALQHHYLNLALQIPGLTLPLIVTGVLSAQLNAAFYIAWMIAGLVYIGPRSLALILYSSCARDPSALPRRLTFTVMLSLGVAAFANAVLLAFAPAILRVFNPVYAVQAATTLRLLALATFALLVREHFNTIQRLRGRLRYASLLASVGTILELAGASTGALLYGMSGLSAGWLTAVLIEAIVMTHTVGRAASLTYSIPPWELDPNWSPPEPLRMGPGSLDESMYFTDVSGLTTRKLLSLVETQKRWAVKPGREATKN